MYVVIMYAVVVYSYGKTNILKICNLIDANNILDNMLLDNKESLDYINYNDTYFRENYNWYCKFNNTIRTIAKDDSQIYAIVEIK